MEKSSTYCVMPHIGLALQNETDFCCCNVNKQSWKNNRRETIHIYSDPLRTSFDSYTRKIIATTLDNNIKHPSCQSCWHQEEAGNISKRQKFNELFGTVEPMEHQPRVLIIKPGNTCNYACRMCNPMTSSSWYKDGHQLEAPSMPFNEYTKRFEIVRNSFNADNFEFWDTLKSWTENFVFVDIYGGEPFLAPALWDCLRHAADLEKSKNIELNLHTNASIYNEDYLHTLTKYKKVNLCVSIDSHIPEQCEYIRHKADYEIIIENLRKFKTYFANHTNVTLGITVTVTPFNVFNIDEICASLKEQFKLNINVNIVTTPEYDIRHLPIPIKQYLISSTQNLSVKNFLRHTIPGCDIEWPRFCRTTDKLDQLRNQKFSEVFPQWWNMLQPHWAN